MIKDLQKKLEEKAKAFGENEGRKLRGKLPPLEYVESAVKKRIASAVDDEIAYAKLPEERQTVTGKNQRKDNTANLRNLLEYLNTLYYCIEEAEAELMRVRRLEELEKQLLSMASAFVSLVEGQG